MRVAISVGWVKSMGVLVTIWSSPVGIKSLLNECVVSCVYCEVVAGDVAVSCSLEVEVGVVAEVAVGGLVGGGGVFDLEFVAVCQGVVHGGCEVAGVAFLSVGALVGKLEGVVL